MPRPRSDEKRAALLDAATRSIAAHGLAVSTATIAKEAGVATGSLFVYFESKGVLLNELFLALKAEVGDAAIAPQSAASAPRAALQRMWSQWLDWAVANPEKRRALAALEVSDDVTAQARASAAALQAAQATVIDGARAGGPLADEPLDFVIALAMGLADAAMDTAIREPHAADARSRVAFDAMWRMLAGSTETQAAPLDAGRPEGTAS